jgi:hypothetical protein
MIEDYYLGLALACTEYNSALASGGTCTFPPMGGYYQKSNHWDISKCTRPWASQFPLHIDYESAS